MVLPPKDVALVTDLLRNTSAWWDGKGDPIDYVVSKNVKRRHLTTSQLAMVGEKIATPKRGTNQHTAQAASSTKGQVAGMLGISTDSIQRARTVRTRGVAALQQAVEAGDISVTAAAEIAQQPEEEQMPPRGHLLPKPRLQKGLMLNVSRRIQKARVVLGSELYQRGQTYPQPMIST
jgi:hypothetical protein